MVGPIFDIFNKNRRNLPKITKIGPTTHFCYFFGNKELRTRIFYSWVWIHKHRRIFCHLFFPKFQCTRYPGVPQMTTPRGKNPQNDFFCSNFFLICFFVLKLKDWHQDCPFTTKNGWDMAFWSFRGTRGPQNLKGHISDIFYDKSTILVSIILY